MTAGLSRIHLGYAPGFRKLAVEQAISFKVVMNRRIGRVDGAYLVTVVEPEGGRRGIEVVYDANEPGAKEWAENARDEARSVWEQVERATSRERERV